MEFKFNGSRDYTGTLESDYFATHLTPDFNGTTDYTGIVEANFLGLQRTNVNVHYTLATVLWSHIIKECAALCADALVQPGCADPLETEPALLLRQMEEQCGAAATSYISISTRLA